MDKPSDTHDSPRHADMNRITAMIGQTKKMRNSETKIVSVRRFQDRAYCEQQFLAEYGSVVPSHTVGEALERDLRRMVNGYIYEKRHFLLAGLREELEFHDYSYVPAFYQIRWELGQAGYRSQAAWIPGTDARVQLIIWIEDDTLMKRQPPL